MKTIACLALLAAVAPAAHADDDLSRILQALPDDTTSPPPAPAPAGEPGALYAELNAERIPPRDGLLVPDPFFARTEQVERAVVDGRGSRTLGAGLRATLSGRFTVLASDALPPGERHERLDLREAYLQWLPAAGTFVEAGRVNVRTGVASGFNPNDYFRSGSTVDPTTQDPTALRQNRLGAFMLRVQRIADDGAISLLVAPRLADDKGLSPSTPPLGLRVAQTNDQTRWLLRDVLRLGDDFSPELVVFKRPGEWRLGASVTRSIDNSSTVYAEWSAGRDHALFDQAIADGVANGDLPAAALAAAPGDGRRLRHDFATGWAWSNDRRMSLTLEYDLHQSGFSGADWDRWFDLGRSGPQGAQLAWYVRGYANFNQDPLARQSLFVRAQWDQAGLRDLYLSGFVNLNLEDGSRLAQLGAEYRAGSANRFRVAGVVLSGRARSEFGSAQNRFDLVAACTHYF